MIEIPQSFVVREECDKAAWHHGFRRKIGEEGGWAVYASTTAQGRLYLAAGGIGGPWYVATDHPGVIAELGIEPWTMPGPGLARFSFGKLSEAYFVLVRLYQLASSLPDAPLAVFRARTKELPQNTEAERLVVQRIGQGIFRDSLLEYWQGKCPLTGIEEPELLRASHIIPWAQCSEEERLNVHNGLLLSALWDAAFDKGLVTFDMNGCPVFSDKLGTAARHVLVAKGQLPVSSEHLGRLEWHRSHVFRG